MSLDVEGHEESALASVDFSAVTIDIIISENPAVESILQRVGYRKQSTAHDHVFLRSGFELGIVQQGRRQPADVASVQRCVAPGTQGIPQFGAPVHAAIAS